MVLLAVVGLGVLGVLVLMGLTEARNLSRGPRRAGLLVRALIIVFLAWRVVTGLSGS
jgi:hypothetical protein